MINFIHKICNFENIFSINFVFEIKPFNEVVKTCVLHDHALRVEKQPFYVSHVKNIHFTYKINPSFHIFERKNISQVYIASLWYPFTILYKPINLPVTLYGGIIKILSLINEICQYFKRLFRITHHAGHILFRLSQHGLR